MPTLADYPELVAQLDRKNGPLAPESISYGSNRRLWWRCPEGRDHVWQTRVAHRTMGGAGCGFCAGLRVSVTNSLAKVAPALAKQWHPAKNGDLRPRDVVAGSPRKVWWKCSKGPDHEWTAAISMRVRGNGCPFCSGYRASAARNFAVAFPEAALEWHPDRNGALRPEDVAAYSEGKVWWRCAHGHEWLTAVLFRTRGQGCPFCAGTLVTPETSLAARDPAVAKQWHSTKNGDLTPRDVLPHSSRRVWWKCRKGPDHVWEATVAGRSKGGCPFCAGKRVSVSTCLATVHPDLASQWHPTKNGKLTPHDVTRGSTHRVWWRCPSGHEWHVCVNARTHRVTGCPQCRRSAPT